MQSPTTSDTDAPIDIAGLRRRLQMDPTDLLRTVTPEFRAVNGTRVRDVARGLDLGAPTIVATGAHAIRGSANAIGADVLCLVSGRIEELARAGDLTTARQLLGMLEHEYNKVVDLLTALNREPMSEAS